MTATENGSSTDRPLRTVAGLPEAHAADAIDQLQHRLTDLIDLTLTLKHIHWNVVGPNFVAVHEMLDQFADQTRLMVDATAERMRALGGVPNGLASAVVAERTWEEYPLDEATTQHHLRTLDEMLDMVILEHRRSRAHIANHDPVTEDLVIEHLRGLEQIQYLTRSFLKGAQPDADQVRFGSNDVDLTDEEAKAADANPRPTEENKRAYREMAKTGATVEGEGAIA